MSATMARGVMDIGSAQGARIAALVSAGLLSACTPPVGPDSIGPLRAVEGYSAAYDASGALVVMRQAMPFANYDGAEAKRAASAICGGAVASSINDHYRDGAWVFPKGCA